MASLATSAPKRLVMPAQAQDRRPGALPSRRRRPHFAVDFGSAVVHLDGELAVEDVRLLAP